MGNISIYRFLKCQFYFSYIWKKIANIRKYRKNDTSFILILNLYICHIDIYSKLHIYLKKTFHVERGFSQMLSFIIIEIKGERLLLLVI